MSRYLLPTTFYSQPGQLAELFALCPACGVVHGFLVQPYDNHDVWTWNGSWSKPTFLPSMLFNRRGRLTKLPLCHSWLTDGRWRFLADSTHGLAGQSAGMAPMTKTLWEYLDDRRLD